MIRADFDRAHPRVQKSAFFKEKRKRLFSSDKRWRAWKSWRLLPWQPRPKRLEELGAEDWTNEKRKRLFSSDKRWRAWKPWRFSPWQPRPKRLEELGAEDWTEEKRRAPM